MNNILKVAITFGTLLIITGVVIISFFINSKNDLKETVSLTDEE